MSKQQTKTDTRAYFKAETLLFSDAHYKFYSRALVREAHQRSTMGKKMKQSTHLRKFGNHVTVHRPPAQETVRPHHRHTNVK